MLTSVPDLRVGFPLCSAVGAYDYKCSTLFSYPEETSWCGPLLKLAGAFLRVGYTEKSLSASSPVGHVVDPPGVGARKIVSDDVGKYHEGPGVAYEVQYVKVSS